MKTKEEVMALAIEAMTPEIEAQVKKGRLVELKRETEEVRKLVKAEFGATIELGVKLYVLLGRFQGLHIADPVALARCEERKAQGRKLPGASELLADYLVREGIVSLTRQRIEQLVAAASLVQEIKNQSATRVADWPLPESEGQIRPLVMLSATAYVKAELWLDAVKRAAGGPVTAAHIEAAIAACSNCRPEPRVKQWDAERTAARIARGHTPAELAQLILALRKLQAQVS
jgi:hypothetical protein